MSHIILSYAKRKSSVTLKFSFSSISLTVVGCFFQCLLVIFFFFSVRSTTFTVIRLNLPFHDSVPRCKIVSRKSSSGRVATFGVENTRTQQIVPKSHHV